MSPPSRCTCRQGLVASSGDWLEWFKHEMSWHWRKPRYGTCVFCFYMAHIVAKGGLFWCLLFIPSFLAIPELARAPTSHRRIGLLIVLPWWASLDHCWRNQAPMVEILFCGRVWNVSLQRWWFLIVFRSFSLLFRRCFLRGDNFYDFGKPCDFEHGNLHLKKLRSSSWFGFCSQTIMVIMAYSSTSTLRNLAFSIVFRAQKLQLYFQKWISFPGDGKRW